MTPEDYKNAFVKYLVNKGLTSASDVIDVLDNCSLNRLTHSPHVTGITGVLILQWNVSNSQDVPVVSDVVSVQFYYGSERELPEGVLHQVVMKVTSDDPRLRNLLTRVNETTIRYDVPSSDLLAVRNWSEMTPDKFASLLYADIEKAVAIVIEEIRERIRTEIRESTYAKAYDAYGVYVAARREYYEALASELSKVKTLDTEEGK